jgi:hypothetical protein
MTLDGLNARIVAVVDQWERTRTGNFLLGIGDLAARLEIAPPYREVRTALDRLERMGYVKVNRTQTSTAVERLERRGTEEVETMARAKTRSDNRDSEPQLVKALEAARVSLLDRVRVGEALIAETSGAETSTVDGLRQLKEKKYSWGEYNEELLRSMFRPPERILRDYSGGPFIGTLGGPPDPIHVQVAELRDDVQRDVRRLKSIIERLPLFESGVKAMPQERVGVGERSVFLVHGHSESAKHNVARFLENGRTNSPMSNGSGHGGSDTGPSASAARLLRPMPGQVSVRTDTGFRSAVLPCQRRSIRRAVSTDGDSTACPTFVLVSQVPK